jgi:hypothetical protein
MLQMAKEKLGKASGGYLSSGLNIGKKIIGYSDEATQANTDLETLGGWLTSNVPRMQGPQSDKDTLMYAQMAAKVGDKLTPIKDRLSAINTLEELNNKYINKQSVQPNILDELAKQVGTKSPLPDATTIPMTLPVKGGIPSGIITVKSAQEASVLPSGTQFMTPDGRLKVRP